MWAGMAAGVGVGSPAMCTRLSACCCRLSTVGCRPFAAVINKGRDVAILIRCVGSSTGTELHRVLLQPSDTAATPATSTAAGQNRGTSTPNEWLAGVLSR